jgi:myo-inositol-1(or 4)-monophosphatase
MLKESDGRMDPLSMVAEVSDIVRGAGKIAAARLGHSRVVRSKEQGDLATDVDMEVNRMIIRELAGRFPSFAILSEETGEQAGEPAGQSEYTWLVDPIDGSKHYTKGIPLYAVSLALRRQSELVMGVVYVPSTDEMFSSVRGCGAKKNGAHIECSGETVLEDALVCVELPSRHTGRERIGEALMRLQCLMLGCQRIRVLGVTALGLCYCACGGFDAYVNLGSYPNAIWDRAGGEIIAQEAGCRLSRFSGLSVAGNASLHDQLRDVLT